MIKKIINNKWFYFVLIFLFMFIFNCMTPYIMDDYQLMFDSTQTHRITSLFQIIKELHRMYFTWGGRILAHFFTYSFLSLPKWIFNIINSIVYVLNVYLIYLISKGNKNVSYAYLLFIHMLIFVFFPVVGQVFFWLDGSCNYSFTLLFQLFFIYLILNIKEDKIKKYFFYFFISFIAGMCNENSSLSLIIFLVLYLINNREYLKLKIVSLVGLIMGYLFLFLAPGNYVRMEIVGGHVSFFYHFFEKLLYLINNFWPMIIGVLLFVVVFFIKNKNEGRICLLFYLTGLVSFFSMLASPQLSVRSFTITVIYIFIIGMKIFFDFNKDIYIIISTIILSVIFLCISVVTIFDYYDYYRFMSKRDSIILKAKKNGEESIKVEKHDLYKNSRIPVSSDFYDIKDDYLEFPNRYMGKYYGIKIYGYDR